MIWIRNYDEIIKVMELMGVKDRYPVRLGAPRGLEDEHTPIDSEGARLIIEEAMREDDRPLYIACQGAVTDVASALLLKPEIAERMTVIWIGGGDYPKGGFEFNLMMDIHAVNVIFSSKVPVWQVPMSLYKVMAVSLAELQLKVRPCGEIGKYLFEQMTVFNQYGIPVTIENDGKCAALAEFWKGSLQGCTNGAVVVLGTGVAGGIIIDGELYRGKRFSAGEYSYVCADSKRMQEMDSYWGLTGGAQGLAKAVARYTGKNWEKYDGMEIFRLANSGDQAVLSGLKDFTDALSVQIYNLNILLDLDVIAIGGGVSQQPLLHQYLKNSMEELNVNHPIRQIAPYIPMPNLTNCMHYNDANLIGALYHFMKTKGELV